MKSVRIYSTPNCKYCQEAKVYFNEQKISFTNYNVAEDARRREEMVEKTQQRTVPVIYIGDDVVLGFDKAKIESLINDHAN